MNGLAAVSGRKTTVPTVSRRRTPGDLFLHPLPIAAAATLAINDSVLKARWPGTLTGKLSDVVGLFVFPIILVCLTELVRGVMRRPWQISDIGILAACVVTSVTFTVVKTVEWASAAYATSIGALRWPLQAADSVISGHPVQAIVPIDVVIDPTDVLAVIAVVGAGLWMHRTVILRCRRGRRPGLGDESAG